MGLSQSRLDQLLAESEQNGTLEFWKAIIDESYRQWMAEHDHVNRQFARMDDQKKAFRARTAHLGLKIEIPTHPYDRDNDSAQSDDNWSCQANTESSVGSPCSLHSEPSSDPFADTPIEVAAETVATQEYEPIFVATCEADTAAATDSDSPSPETFADPTEARTEVVATPAITPIIIVTRAADNADETSFDSPSSSTCGAEVQGEGTPESQPIVTPADISPVPSIHIELGPDLKAALQIYLESTISATASNVAATRIGRHKFYFAGDSDAEDDKEVTTAPVDNGSIDHNPHLESVDFQPGNCKPPVNPRKLGRVVKITYNNSGVATYEYADGRVWIGDNEISGWAAIEAIFDDDDASGPITTPAPLYDSTLVHETAPLRPYEQTWLDEMYMCRSRVDVRPEDAVTGLDWDEYCRDLRDQQRRRGVVIAERAVPLNCRLRDLI